MPIVITKTTLGNQFFQFALNRRSSPLSGIVAGWLQGINTGGPTSISGDDSSGGRTMAFGLTKNTTIASPTLGTPVACLELPTVGSKFRFKWVVKPGQRQISVLTQQLQNWPGQGPTMTIKKNTNVGINSDIVIMVNPTGSGWNIMGPVIFTATGTDVVYVDLQNNLQNSYASAYFDHIVVV